MSFVDECRLIVRAGRGGNGSASLHSEPFKPRGGPDGGDGGNGGSVVLEVDRGVNDLSVLADHPHQRAADGGPGRSSKRTGARGKDLVLRVPDGTVIRDERGLLADLVGEGARAVVARGGRGGRGNAALKGPKNVVPKTSEPGEEGEERRLEIELRTVADVGLVGLPNAGKSTLLGCLTAARPKIADYPFTTLTPNLGVAGAEDDRFVVADVPGLIEGASTGRGLGLQFLRHVVRCRILVLVIDLSGDPAGDLEVLRGELRAYGHGLVERPSVVVGSKADLVEDPETIVRGLGEGAIAVSSVSGAGLEELAGRLAAAVTGAVAAEPERGSHVVLRPGRAPFSVERASDGAFEVTGRAVELAVRQVDLDDERQVADLQRRLRRLGVFRKLAALGAVAGNEVRISGSAFDYVPDEPDGGSVEHDGEGRSAR